MTEAFVIIPAYNPGPYLRPALESLVSQTFVDWQGVVVGDGSTEELRTAQDWDRWLRIAADHPIAHLGDVLAQYRQHDGALSRDWRLTLDESLQILSRHPAAAAHGGAP